MTQPQTMSINSQPQPQTYNTGQSDLVPLQWLLFQRGDTVLKIFHL